LAIVSEGDLMRRAEAGTERRHSRWLASTEALAAEFVRSHARKVTDIMTRHVVTTKPETPISEIASLLETNGIKRVLVVKDGKVVGIVSRANLPQALASAPKETPAVPSPDDSIIRTKVETQLKAQRWTSPWLLNVIVHGGIVEIWGIVDPQAEIMAARVIAEGHLEK
jgi:CBS domain-containing protein